MDFFSVKEGTELSEKIQWKELRGIERLAGAVLVQAIEDVHRGPTGAREDAIRWIADCRADQFSFEHCCRIVGRNPDKVRHRVLREILNCLVQAGREESSAMSN